MKQLIIILLTIIMPCAESKGQLYYFRSYSGQEGLMHPFIYSIGQDIDGYLWVGTVEGLYIFDGFEFKYYTTDQGLADNFITRIFRDNKDRMWLGHQNGSVSVFSKRGIVILNDDSDNQGAVTDIIEDDLGNVWISVQNQGFLFVDESLEANAVSFSVDEEPITQMESAGNLEFIIGTHENLYFARYDTMHKNMEVFENFREYPGSKVVEIIKSSSDEFLIVSQEDGLFGLHFNSASEFSINTYDNNADGCLDNLQGGIMDPAGNLWLISLGYGLIQYKKNAQHFYLRTASVTPQNGLVSGNVKSIFNDLEGNIWLGMFGDGLFRYVDNEIKHYKTVSEKDLINPTVIANNPDRFLISSGDQLYEMNQTADSIYRTYLLPVSSSDEMINTIYLSQDERIWLGYERSGLFVSDRSIPGFLPVTISNNNLSNSINHITGRNDIIWVSTKRGLCKIDNETGTVHWFFTDQGLPHNNIQQTYIDSKERVLISTICKEIYFINTSDEVSILEGSGIGLLNSVISITEERDGTMWAATQGNGIWKVSKDLENQNFTSASGLLSDYCYSLVLTKEDKPAVTHRGGISHIDLESNRVLTLGQNEGVNSSTIFLPNAIRRDHLGQIWLGTSDGLIQFTPESSDNQILPPLLNVTSILIDGDTIIPEGGRIKVRPGLYEIEVNYIGISLRNPEQVYYQTKFKGYNKDWSDPSVNRKVLYGQVGYGDYVFKIRAYNGYGQSTELSSAFELIIKKPVYYSAWFYVLISLIIGFSFYITLRIRERNHRMVQERLLKNLDEKTKEIIVKEEIIKERKKVEKILIDAKNKAELSEKLKTAFLQNMSHEIRTPMNAIVGFSQLLKEEGITTKSRDEFVKNISTNAESLLKLIDDILDLSSLETKQLELILDIYSVNEIILDLESLYQQRLINEGKTAIALSSSVPAEDGIKMVVDKTRLKQILDNLLDNALKFTESGRIIFGYHLSDKKITFFVKDTGIGLSEDKQEVVFDLFRKVEDDRLKLYGGTGLGLTLAKYLVNLMGGEIDVESEKGKGSNFYFELPYKTEIKPVDHPE